VSLYDKPVRLLMHDMVKDMGLTPDQIVDRRDMVEWFASRYPLVKESTISAHLIRMSVNAPSRLHHSLFSDGSDDLFFQVDRSQFRLYNAKSDPTPIRTTADVQEKEEEESAVTMQESSEFAYERDLRDYLAKNLALLEPGLKLYDEEGVTGVEFPAGGRFIDILAVDSENRYVVIELKVSKGYDRVIGQLLRYIGWIEDRHADPGRAVRGIIVAKSITEDLRLACKRLSA